MRYRHRHVVEAVALGILAAACQDLPTDPASPAAPPSSSASRDLLGSLGSPSPRGDGTASPFQCFTSEVAPGGPHRYGYGRLSLRFPARAVPNDQRTALYKFRLQSPTGEVLAAANCRIPYSPEAIALMNRRFHGKGAPVEQEAQDQFASANSTGDPIILDPIIVVGTPSPPGYPAGSWWGDQGGWGSQGDYYDPTYTGGPTYDPGTPDEPCNTGLAVIDNPETQYGFDRLWSRSGFGKPMAERKEQGAWLILKADGTVGWQELPSDWVRTPCGIDPPPTFVIPEGTIALVHTHPFARGELLTECEKQELGGGRSLYTNYAGDTSVDDDEFMKRMRETVAPAMIGIVIDNEQILGYDGSGNLQPIPRCGY